MATDVNRRYTDMRNKLDSLGMMQTLHPDSLQLVEKLFSDYIKVSEQYQTLKRQKVLQSQTNRTNIEDTKESDYKFDLLNKQYHQLLEENKQIKGELNHKNQMSTDEADRRIKAIRDKYDSKIAELTEKLVSFERSSERIGGDRQELLDRIDTLLEENHSLSQSNKKTQKIYVQALQQCEALKLQLSQTFECSQSVDRSKSMDLEVMLQRKTNQIQLLEESELVLKAKITALTRQIQQSEGEKRRTLLQGKSVMNISEALKQENRQLQKANMNIKSELQHLSNSYELLKKAKSNLEGELFKYKQQQMSSKYTQQTSSLAKNRLQILYEDSVKTIQSKKLQIDDLHHQIEQKQKDIVLYESKIKQLSMKNSMLNRNINELQTELQTVSGKLSAKLRENRQLDTAKGLLERQLRQLQPIKDQYKQLEDKIKNKNLSEEHLTQKDVKNRKNMQVQGKIYEEQIAIMRENEQSLVIKNEKLQSELKRMQVVITNGGKQVQLLNCQKQELIREIKDLKEQLGAIRNSDHNSKTSTIKLQQRLNSSEILIQDLKTTLQAETQKTKAIMQQISSLQSALNQSEEKSQTLHNDNVQLRRLCESLESTKCELFQKLKLTADQRMGNEQEKLRYNQEYQQLRDTIHKQQEELRRKQTAMIAIDDERDQMQLLLDTKTEENAQQKIHIDQLEGKMRMVNKERDKGEMNVHVLQTHTNSLEMDNEALKKTVERLTLEIQSKLAIANKLQIQLGSQSNEMDMLVLSNKDIQRELDRLRAAYADIEKKFRVRTSDYDQSRQQSEVLRMENEDLSTNYQEQIAERKRLEGHVQQLEEANHQMYEHLQQRDQQVAELAQHVMLCQQKQTQYMNQITSYERQLGIVGNQLNIKQDELRRAMAERDNYRIQYSRRREPNDLRAVFEQRLSLVQNELQLKRRECESLRQQVRQLEKVIEMERSTNLVMTRELNNHHSTPIKAILGQSMLDSNVENSSLHANSLERPEMRLQESFESQGQSSICSKMLRQRIQKIQLQYNNTNIRSKY